MVEATLANEPVGSSEAPGLLFINYKAPDYTGHVFGMFDPMTGDALRDVDEQLGRLVVAAGRSLPGPVRADRDGRSRPVPAPRRRRRRPSRPDPALGRPRARVRRRPVRPRPERRALRGVPARGRALGRRCDARGRGLVPPRLPVPAEHRAVRAAERGRAGTAGPATVRRRVRDLVPRHTRRAATSTPTSGPASIRRAIPPASLRASPDGAWSSSRATGRCWTANRGEGAALAMRLVVKMAEVARAPRLRDVTQAPHRLLPVPRAGRPGLRRTPPRRRSDRVGPRDLERELARSAPSGARSSR